MRTRVLNKMTKAEVEESLQRNDVIFVPVGTVETHGRFPVDVETMIPEAITQLLAEQADGLCLSGLPYFFCGATTEARGSVQMSVGAGVDYLLELAKSLIKQGFKRQIWIGGHAPTFLSLTMLRNELKKETGVEIMYMRNVGLPPKKYDENGERLPWIRDINYLILGAYRVLGRLDEIRINPEVEEKDALDSNIMPDDETDEYNYIFKFGPLSGQVGFYHNKPECHCSFYGEVRSEEELESVSLAGEKIMRDNINSGELEEALEYLRVCNEN